MYLIHEQTPLNRSRMQLDLLRDYSKDELTTLWNPLPTLDINDTDPDILYTVELYQITCGQNILINRTEVAGRNVTEEGLDLMQIYKAVIAARNNVSGARNGPSVEMKGISVYFLFLFGGEGESGKCIIMIIVQNSR